MHEEDYDQDTPHFLDLMKRLTLSLRMERNGNIKIARTGKRSKVQAGCEVRATATSNKQQICKDVSVRQKPERPSRTPASRALKDPSGLARSLSCLVDSKITGSTAFTYDWALVLMLPRMTKKRKITWRIRWQIPETSATRTYQKGGCGFPVCAFGNGPNGAREFFSRLLLHRDRRGSALHGFDAMEGVAKSYHHCCCLCC